MIQMFWCLVVQKIIVNKVSSSDYFNIINVVRVNSWKTNTAVVHLTSEDLVAEEVVSEETTITVSKVMGFSHSNIG